MFVYKQCSLLHKYYIINWAVFDTKDPDPQHWFTVGMWTTIFGIPASSWFISWLLLQQPIITTHNCTPQHQLQYWRRYPRNGMTPTHNPLPPKPPRPCAPPTPQSSCLTCSDPNVTSSTPPPSRDHYNWEHAHTPPPPPGATTGAVSQVSRVLAMGGWGGKKRGCLISWRR
jgi:hypothetical protein